MKFVLLCVSVSLWWFLPCAAQQPPRKNKNETIFHRHETAPPAEQTPATTRGEPDAGDIHGDLYTNQFFGFSYTLPAALTTVTDIAAGQEDLSQRAFLLLSLESDVDPGERPEALAIIADKIPAAPATGLPPTYMKQLADIAAKRGGQPVGSVREETFGGVKFQRQDFEYPAGNAAQAPPGFQSTVVTPRRGYALIFNFAAATREQIDKLVQSLGSLKFSK
jgi:hypothetical protein